MNAPDLSRLNSPETPFHCTPEEYLAFEDKAVQRHEYIDGIVRVVDDSTVTHSMIGSNLICCLANRLADQPCRPFGCSLKVRIPPPRLSYVYTDVLVACPPYEMEDERQIALLNPKVVVEVLSERTADYDRTEKLELYSRVPSIEVYLLVEQDQPYVQTFTFHRDSGDDLKQLVTLGFHDGLAATVPLPCLGIELTLAEIYEDVEFSAAP